MVCLLRVVVKRSRWSVTVADPASTAAVVGSSGDSSLGGDGLVDSRGGSMVQSRLRFLMNGFDMSSGVDGGLKFMMR